MVLKQGHSHELLTTGSVVRTRAGEHLGRLKRRFFIALLCFTLLCNSLPDKELERRYTTHTTLFPTGGENLSFCILCFISLCFIISCKQYVSGMSAENFAMGWFLWE
jgi:hypothetical protein